MRKKKQSKQQKGDLILRAKVFALEDVQVEVDTTYYGEKEDIKVIDVIVTDYNRRDDYGDYHLEVVSFTEAQALNMIEALKWALAQEKIK